MKTKILILCLFLFSNLKAQIDYFPPLLGNEWDTLSISGLGWCDDQLDELLVYLEEHNTKAFLILKDGKIVVEKYFGDTDMDTPLAWNSAGKTITSLLVGIAQEDGLLSIADRISDYLGTGWTSLPPDKEDAITIRHQLTMTTGLNDLNFFNTNPNALTYVADAGTRWAYHNAPYTLLTNVIENAADSMSINTFALLNLKLQTGMDGLFIPIPLITSEIFYSSARSMARMGSLMLNKGTWDNTVVLGDQDYFSQMITPSQSINESYGYLWWLNGFDSYIAPGSQQVFPGSLAPNAPVDLYMAAGKDGQFLDIIPSKNLVVIRMGDAPDDDLVPINFHNEMWSYIAALLCESTATEDLNSLDQMAVFPNPFDEVLYIESDTEIKTIRLYSTIGQVIFEQENVDQISGKGLAPGIYWLALEDLNHRRIVKKIIRN
ncbi:MAG: CubicO group peptidase (beta-lactamase class C family) [Saprospiraceae bacterium]|jgi:CubicO group peptidase (beta-lactamase class C family)